jgi:splicing factor U2AF 65 kDa subunit
MDDRRGPRGGPPRDRDADRERRRSASPPPKKREPTPDLTDVVPVLERKRRLTQWDIKPLGYDNVTAEQAKLSGMFPLPGAPRQQTVDPTKLHAMMSQPGGGVSNAALKPGNSRQSKRLIITNLPASATEDGVVQFFNLQLNGLNVIEGTDPCAACQISPDHAFAMLEFRNSADATVALALDGISMEAEDAHNGNGTGAGRGLQIRRPKDYIVPAVVEDPNYDPDSDVPSSVVIDSPNKISVANIPHYLSEDQVIELLVSFGKLKSFVLVKDRSTEESRVSCFSLPVADRIC